MARWSSFSIFKRPMACSCITGSNTRYPRPSSLAWYMAVSASLSSSSEEVLLWAVPRAMPMEGLMNSSRPSRTNGSLKASTIRPATRTASAGFSTSSTMTVNSSPPKRAKVSSGRRHPLRRSPTATSRRSPTSWPKESFTSLKLSRSINSTATFLRPDRLLVRSRACLRRSMNRERLGRPVRES
jgi:hypothetical protein